MIKVRKYEFFEGTRSLGGFLIINKTVLSFPSLSLDDTYNRKLAAEMLNWYRVNNKYTVKVEKNIYRI